MKQSHAPLILFVVLIVCASLAQAQEQSSGSPVTVKDDGAFSGKRKVELSAQQISATLTMTISAEIDIRTRGDRFRDLGTSTVKFVSTTGQREYGDQRTEFNFMVDGVRIIGGRASSSPLTDKREKDGKEIAVGAIGTGALEEIGRGREVKIKLGEQVFTLDKTAIKNIAQFVRELVK